MTNHLQSLQSRRAELLQRIARIDELIMAEIDDVLAGNETSDRQRASSSSSASSSASGKQSSDSASSSSPASSSRGGDSEGSSAQGSKKAQKAASSYPGGVRTWSDKILHTLTNSGGRGMSTGDIMKALKGAEGEGGSRVVPATINTTLQAMESKAKSIRAERGATGRKLHYAAGSQGASSSASGNGSNGAGGSTSGDSGSTAGSTAGNAGSTSGEGGNAAGGEQSGS